MTRAASESTTAPPRAARGAVAVIFLVNGAVFANWVPRIPAVKAELGLTEGLLGLALLGMGIGGLCGSVLAGTLVARYGSRRVTLTSCLLLSAAFVLPGVAPSWPALAGALVLIGAADASMDVGMNAHGVAVERRYGRSIMNGFHAFWSLGAVLGSLAGSFAAARDFPVAWHLGAAGLVLGLLAVASAPAMLTAGADRQPTTSRPQLALPTRAVGVLGLLALLAALVEDTPASWSAVYLREDLGATPGVAGLAYAAFTAAMTAGRLLGDRAVERFGPVRTTRAGTALAAAGLACALVIGSPAAAITGFALAGLGMATVFPLAFSAAGHLPGLPPGQAIGMVALIARFGVLLGPPLIGGVAELLSLPLALGLVVAASAGIAVLAHGLAPARQP